MAFADERRAEAYRLVTLEKNNTASLVTGGKVVTRLIEFDC